MNPIEDLSSPEETFRVTLDVPASIVDWLDRVKAQMGFQSRGAVVVQVLKELCHDSCHPGEKTKRKEAD